MKWPAAFVLTVPLLLSAVLVACGGGGGDGSGSGGIPQVKCVALGIQGLEASGLPAFALSASTPPAPTTPPADWQAPRVPGRLLVSTAATPTSAGLSVQSLNLLSTLKAQEVAPGLHLLYTPAGQSDKALAAQLAQAGLKVQPDFLYQPLSSVNDPGFPGNAGINISGMTLTQDYLNRIAVPGAWDVLQSCGLAATGATTAIVDGGVDASHPDLQGRVVAQTSYLTGKDAKTLTHATAVAGIVGATANNGLGVSGIGQATPLISEEVTSSAGATTSSVTKALQDAVKRGARVINLSLGMLGNPGDAALDQALTTAARSAVLVAAAGNSPDDVYYPASHPAVIAVGAVGSRDDALACYSARPGSVAERGLDVVAPGGTGYVCSDSKTELNLLVLEPGGGYGLQAGTSFAAPQVAGVAALMRAANPGLSADQTRTLLLGSVKNSAGLPLLDAKAAVTAAIRGGR